MFTSQLLFIGSTELILIVAVVLLLFGGKKLPEMMRGMGQGVRSFKEGMNEVGDGRTPSSEHAPTEELTDEDFSEKDGGKE